MVIDFFTLIDSVFRGFVLFVYSFVATCFWLIWSPIRQPLLRYRDYMRPRAKQVGPWAFMVLCFMIATVLMPGIFSDGYGSAFNRGITSMLFKGKNAGNDVLIVFVLSVALAVAVDV